MQLANSRVEHFTPAMVSDNKSNSHLCQAYVLIHLVVQVHTHSIELLLLGMCYYIRDARFCFSRKAVWIRANFSQSAHYSFFFSLVAMQ